MTTEHKYTPEQIKASEACDTLIDEYKSQREKQPWGRYQLANIREIPVDGTLGDGGPFWRIQVTLEDDSLNHRPILAEALTIGRPSPGLLDTKCHIPTDG